MMWRCLCKWQFFREMKAKQKIEWSIFVQALIKQLWNFSVEAGNKSTPATKSENGQSTGRTAKIRLRVLEMEKWLWCLFFQL